MPAQWTEPSADDARSDGSPDGQDSPVTPSERDLLDENSLLEEQPYAALEEELVTYASPDDADLEGPGSW